MEYYEALYSRKCKTHICWLELSERKMVGTDLNHETEEKVQVIWDCLKVASERQKSYANLKRKDIEFEIGNKVFLKVSPRKKVSRFDRKWKLNLRFIGSYEILKRNELVAYRLSLSSVLDKIHNIFHVLMLQPNLTYN